MNTAKTATSLLAVGSDFCFTSQVARVLCKSGSSFLASSQYAAAWLAGGQMEALDRASPCRRRGTQSWHGAPRAHGQIGESWGRPSIWHNVQPSTASADGIKLETFRAYFAPRCLRSFDDCVCGRPEDVTTRVGGFPPMSVSLQGMGASRRSSIHLTRSQASGRGRKPENFQRRQRVQASLVPRDC